jgi:hypothetical protein
MNAEDFLDDKQPTVTKDEKSSTKLNQKEDTSNKNKEQSKVSADSFLDDEEEYKPKKIGYGIDRIIKHPVSAAVGELTSAAGLLTGLPKMVAEDVSVLAVPGALTLAEKTGVIKPSTEAAKVKVGVEAGKKLSSDLGLDILAEAPTKIATMMGLDKKTLESSGVNLAMGKLGEGINWIADQTNKLTGVPKEQITAMLDLGMLKMGDVIDPVTKKLNDKFIDKVTNVTQTEVDAYRKKLDEQSEA